MPRLPGMIAISVALLLPGSLAAQTFAPGRETYPRPAASRSTLAPSWTDSATEQTSYAPTPGNRGEMRAEYQTPVSLGEKPRDEGQLPPAQAPPSAASSQGRATSLPLSPAKREPPLKFAPPERSSPPPASAPVGGFRSLVTIGCSLVIVLSVFAVFAWLMRRTLPAAAAPLPGDVVQVLGRTIVAHRQQLQLIRFGSKLLLVSVTPGGAETLAEITDPDEVIHLTGLCQQTRPGSTTAAFRQVLAQLAGERTHER